MKNFFTLVFFIFQAVVALAQQNNMKSPNPNVAGLDPSVVAGHFEMNIENKEKRVVEHINVNYAISPVPFNDILNLELSTAEPTWFTASVTEVNDAGINVLARWKPLQKSYVYKDAINISSLKPGKYNLNIIHGFSDVILYQIPFTKSKQ